MWFKAGNDDMILALKEKESDWHMHIVG